LLLNLDFFWHLHDEHNQQVPRDNNLVQPGNYYIVSDSEQILFFVLIFAFSLSLIFFGI